MIAARWITEHRAPLVAVAIVAAATRLAVPRLQRPGHLDLIAAQAMDMSDIRPPVGAAPVALAAVRPAGSCLLIPTESVVAQPGGGCVWVAAGAQSSMLRYKARCGMTYSAADASRFGFHCPMDGGPLSPLGMAATVPLTARRVAIIAVQWHGVTTEVKAPDLRPSDHVVVRGQEDLRPGDSIVETRWAADGPVELPTATQVAHGRRYRCPNCDMVFTAEDAARTGFKDPMDGAQLRSEGAE